MEQQRILFINLKTELAELAADILEENNFEVTNVESLEKMKTSRPKNFLRNPGRLFKL
jgi:DNA-binding response OmpR family regulator